MADGGLSRADRTPTVPSMLFENLGTWEVSARLDSEEKLSGVFAQTYPEDAVSVLMGTVRAKSQIRSSEWTRWTFFCVERDHRRTTVFALTEFGRPAKVLETLAG